MSQAGVSTSVRDIQYGIAAANISGTVGIHYHHPQARPQTPPLPTHNIPFDRNTHFVNREDIFSQISIKCAGQASRTALVGLGGVGKSQLAIEYGHQTRLEHKDTWVLWCHASNTARLNSSLSEIASLVRAPGYESPQADHFKLVKNWLHDPRNRKWLLIIDNADDKAVIAQQSSSSTSEPLRTLYQGSDGCVLITSRTKDAVRELVEDDQMLEIHPMDPLESQRLLKDQLGLLGSSDEDLKALASALENMPLALTQAAAYIQRRASKTSVKQYLELFNKNDQAKINLLSKKAGILYRDWDAKSSILTTLMISFKDIRETSPSAADVLCLMGFFDRQGIPEELLRPKTSDNISRRSSVQGRMAGIWELQSLLEDEEKDRVSEHEERGGFSADNTTVEHARDLEDQEDFDSDIEILRDYAFIKTNTAGTFEIHALVQLATCYWLKGLGDYDFWRDRSIKVLSEHFTYTTESDFMKRERLIAHVKTAIRNKPENQDVLVEWAWLMFAAGGHESNKNSLHEAMEMTTLSWSTRAEILGRYDPSTLDSLYDIGMTVFGLLSRDDRDKQSELRFLQETQNLWQSASDMIRERESWSVLFMVCEIAARIYIRNKEDSNAEKLLSECIPCSKEQFGPDSLETFGLQIKFSRLLMVQGDGKMAEKMLSEMYNKLMDMLKVLQQYMRTKEHETMRHTLTDVLGTWARCLEIQKNLEGAEAKYRNLLLWEQNSDSSPYHIVLTENSLAQCLIKQNRLEDAAQVLERSEEWQMAKLGRIYHSHQVLTTLSRLATAYVENNQYKKAIPLFEKVLQYQREVYGSTTREVLYTLSDLASAYLDDEQYSNAMSYYEEYTASEEGRYRITHDGEWEVADSLAYCYYKLSKYDEAIETFGQYLHLRESTIPKSNIGGIVYALEYLGHTYRKQEKHTEATTYYRRCLDEQRSLKGEKHKDTLWPLSWLSKALHASGHAQEAITQLEECVQLSTELLGPEDTETVKFEERLKNWRSEVTRKHHEVAAEDFSTSLSSHSTALVESMDHMKIEESEKPSSVSTKARKWWSRKLKRR